MAQSVTTDEIFKTTTGDGVAELAGLYRLTDRLYRARSPEDAYDATLDAIADTLGCARASILLFDEEGVMRFVAWRGLSAEYRTAVDGHTPWTAGQRDPDPIFVSDIAETDEPDWLKQVIAAQGITALAFIPLVSQGVVIGKFMAYFAERHVFGEHERNLAVTVARQLGFSLERARAEAARREAEEELRHSEQRFRLMSEYAPVMIWMSDTEGHCLHLNAMQREFWNVAEDQIEAFDWTGTMHPDDAAAIGQAIGAAAARREPATIEGRYLRADGDYRVLLTEARPRFSARGTFQGMIGVNVDITERKQAEEHRKLMIHELNHRVKNTLAVVQALAKQTFDRSDPDGRLAVFGARLSALARAHNLLAAESWTNASLQDVAERVLSGPAALASRIAIQGPHVALSPKQAVTLTMALHELHTNALKYGALANDDGSVSLRWTLEEGPTLVVAWTESGGPAVSLPESRGFGTLMIEQALVAEFDAEVTMDFAPGGLVCIIRAPWA